MNKTAAFAAIAATIFIVNALVMYSIRPYGYNLSSMIRITEREREGVVPEYFQKGFAIFKDGGYDGQCYYYVAMDPFIKAGLYRNAYRYQRILYPLISRALTFGNLSLLPYTMYLVNLASLAVGMYFFILILKHYSLSPLWSLFYGLSPPSIMTVQYDLPSPLSVALLIAAVYFYVVRDRVYVTAALFALAFLAREDSIVVFLPLILWDVIGKRSLKRAAVIASSLIPFFLWQYYVTSRIGEVPTGASSGVLSPIPFSGVAGYFSSPTVTGPGGFQKNIVFFTVFAYFMAVGAVMLRSLIKKRHPFYMMAMAYPVLATFTVSSQWDNFSGLLRMFYGLFPFLTLSYAVDKSPAIRYSVYFIGLLTLLTVIRIVFISPVYPYTVWGS